MRGLHLALIILGIILSGCLTEPEIKSVESHWGKVTPEETEIISKVTLNNPNPISIPLSDLEIDLYMNGIHMGKGKAVGDTTISPGEDSITLSTIIENDRLKDWWITHIKNGEKTQMKIKYNLVFSVFGFTLKVPFEMSDHFETTILSQLSSIDFGERGGVIEIKKMDFKWDTREKMTYIVATMKVENNIPVEIPLKFIKYRLVMNGIEMSSGEITDNLSIPPSGQKDFKINIAIENSKIPEWWVTHIKNNERTTALIDMQIGMKINGKEETFDISKEFEFYTAIAS